MGERKGATGGSARSIGGIGAGVTPHPPGPPSSPLAGIPSASTIHITFLNLRDLNFPSHRVAELRFFLALHIRILEVKPQGQGRGLKLEGLKADCVILSQRLTFGCLVCSMGMPSGSHLLGPGVTGECRQTGICLWWAEPRLPGDMPGGPWTLPQLFWPPSSKWDWNGGTGKRASALWLAAGGGQSSGLLLRARGSLSVCPSYPRQLFRHQVRGKESGSLVARVVSCQACLLCWPARLPCWWFFGLCSLAFPDNSAGDPLTHPPSASPASAKHLVWKKRHHQRSPGFLLRASHVNPASPTPFPSLASPHLSLTGSRAREGRI